MRTIPILTPQGCPERKRHTNDPQEPTGYLAWHEWAERKTRTHECSRCRFCGFFVIWTKRERPLTDAEMARLFPHSGYEEATS